MINPSIVSALAVLAGSSVGALTPVLSNYVLQRSSSRRDLMNREIADRQILYSDFITEATRLFADALTRNSFELNDAVALYALVSRIRLLAPDEVVLAAEAVAKSILEHYGAANMTLDDLREAAIRFHPDRLDVFSKACRKDLLKLAVWNNPGISR